MNDNVKQDQWSVWRAMLNGEVPEISVDTPYSGFYRKTVKKGSKEMGAVLIHIPEGGKDFICEQVSVSFGTTYNTDFDEIAEIFSFASKNPITRDEYIKFKQTKEWSDDASKELTLDDNEKQISDTEPSNDPEDIFDGIKIAKGIDPEFLKELKEEVLKFREAELELRKTIKDNKDLEKSYLKARILIHQEKIAIDEILEKPIESENDANRVAHVTSELVSFKGLLKQRHSEQKHYHYQFGRMVDNRWNTWIETIHKEYVPKLDKHLLVWTKKKAEEQKKKKLEAEKKAREEEEAARKLEEERKRLEEESRKKNDPDSKLEVDKQIADIESEIENKQKEVNKLDKEATTTVKASAGNVSGKKRTMTKKKDARIVDFDKAYDFLRTNKDFRQIAEEFMIRKAKGGLEIEGVEVFEEDVMR